MVSAVPKRLLVPVLLCHACMISGCGVFLDALPEARTALDSTSLVQVDEHRRGYVFQPLTDVQSIGLILYPGALVEAAAYAPLAMKLAEEGYPVALPRFPLRLAVLAPNRAMTFIDSSDVAVEEWVIAGHSLGGAMAARFVKRNAPDAVLGLALLAAFPADSDDLSGRENLNVVSIFGSRDGVSEPEEVLSAAPLLPERTAFIEIAGGNHAQFGFYGPQRGDNQATISREAQQASLVEALAGFLGRLSNRDNR